MKRNKSAFDAQSFKLVLVGEAAVGKSCLMSRFIKNQFNLEHKSTICAEFGTRILTLHNNDSSKIKLVLWDTAGQQKYRSIVRNFYRSSSVILLIYDITKNVTFESLPGWLVDARENSPKTTQFVVVGTHLDNAISREVQSLKVEDWARSESIQLWFEISSLTGQNIENMFELIAYRLLQKRASIKDEIKNEKHLKQNPSMINSLLRSSYPADGQQQSKGCCTR